MTHSLTTQSTPKGIIHNSALFGSSFKPKLLNPQTRASIFTLVHLTTHEIQSQMETHYLNQCYHLGLEIARLMNSLSNPQLREVEEYLRDQLHHKHHLPPQEMETFMAKLNLIANGSNNELPQDTLSPLERPVSDYNTRTREEASPRVSLILSGFGRPGTAPGRHPAGQEKGVEFTPPEQSRNQPTPDELHQTSAHTQRLVCGSSTADRSSNTPGSLGEELRPGPTDPIPLASSSPKGSSGAMPGEGTTPLTLSPSPRNQIKPSLHAASSLAGGRGHKTSASPQNTIPFSRTSAEGDLLMADFTYDRSQRYWDAVGLSNTILQGDLKEVPLVTSHLPREQTRDLLDRVCEEVDLEIPAPNPGHPNLQIRNRIHRVWGISDPASNFYQAPVEFKGHRFPSREHAIQYSKMRICGIPHHKILYYLTSEKGRAQVLKAANLKGLDPTHPGEFKLMANTIISITRKSTKRWDDVKLLVVTQIMIAGAFSNKTFRHALLDPGTDYFLHQVRQTNQNYWAGQGNMHGHALNFTRRVLISLASHLRATGALNIWGPYTKYIPAHITTALQRSTEAAFQGINRAPLQWETLYDTTRTQPTTPTLIEEHFKAGRRNPPPTLKQQLQEQTGARDKQLRLDIQEEMDKALPEGDWITVDDYYTSQPIPPSNSKTAHTWTKPKKSVRLPKPSEGHGPDIVDWSTTDTSSDAGTPTTNRFQALPVEEPTEVTRTPGDNPPPQPQRTPRTKKRRRTVSLPTSPSNSIEEIPLPPRKKKSHTPQTKEKRPRASPTGTSPPPKRILTIPDSPPINRQEPERPPLDPAPIPAPRDGDTQAHPQDLTEEVVTTKLDTPGPQTTTQQKEKTAPQHTNTDLETSNNQTRGREPTRERGHTRDPMVRATIQPKVTAYLNPTPREVEGVANTTDPDPHTGRPLSPSLYSSEEEDQGHPPTREHNQPKRQLSVKIKRMDPKPACPITHQITRKVDIIPRGGKKVQIYNKVGNFQGSTSVRSSVLIFSDTGLACISKVPDKVQLIAIKELTPDMFPFLAKRTGACGPQKNINHVILSLGYTPTRNVNCPSKIDPTKLRPYIVEGINSMRKTYPNATFTMLLAHPPPTWGNLKASKKFNTEVLRAAATQTNMKVASKAFTFTRTLLGDLTTDSPNEILTSILQLAGFKTDSSKN